MKRTKTLNKRPDFAENAGVTLLEVVIAGSIVATALALMIGQVVAMDNTRDRADFEEAATNFNQNMMESMRGMGLNGILTYQPPLDDPVAGTVTIDGYGEAEVSVFAVVTDPVTLQPVMFQCGVDDPATVVNPPNPIEVQMELLRVDGYYGQGRSMRYRTSTMLSY